MDSKLNPRSMRWEARRWCNGDDDWTNWQPCTDEQKDRWAAQGDFQFRQVSTPPTQPAASSRGDGGGG